MVSLPEPALSLVTPPNLILIFLLVLKIKLKVNVYWLVFIFPFHLFLFFTSAGFGVLFYDFYAYSLRYLA